jgi:hypothetical protein
MNTVEMTLPGGFSVDGSWHRTVHLRPVTGWDEAFLVEEGRFLLPASRITALLTRCLTSLGPGKPVTTEAVRELTVGDREALLLYLRRMTLGERMACAVSCPNRTCGEKLDLDLKVSDLLLPPYCHQEAVHERVIENGDGSFLVRFRLPTGADQEAAAVLGRETSEAAVNLVLERCLQQVVAQGSASQPVSHLSGTLLQALARSMSELDPQADIRLELACPACGALFELPLDAGDYFFRELTGNREDLYREVHLMAFHYHWSEADIMNMTRHRRKSHVDLILETLHGR